MAIELVDLPEGKVFHRFLAILPIENSYLPIKHGDVPSLFGMTRSGHFDV